MDRCQYTRHSPHGRVPGESERPGIRVCTPSTMPGFYDKSRENCPGTNTALGVPGFHGNTVSMELTLPPKKLKKIRAESRKMLREVEQVSAHALSRLIGKMNATNQVIPPAPLFYRNLQMDLSHSETSGSGLQDDLVSFPQQQRGTDMVGQPDSQVEWQVNALGGAQVCHRVGRLEPGLGSILPGHQYGGPWSPQEREWHINCLELLAATLAL